MAGSLRPTLLRTYKERRLVVPVGLVNEVPVRPADADSQRLPGAIDLVR
jgi:hypothetical protein